MTLTTVTISALKLTFINGRRAVVEVEVDGVFHQICEVPVTWPQNFIIEASEIKRKASLTPLTEHED